MNSENTMQQAKQGTLSVIFPGQWLLIDAKTKIFVGDQLHSTHSTKQGFRAEIPISSASMILKVEIAGIKSTKYELRGMDIMQDYTMELEYSTNLGKFAKEYKISKDENVVVDVNRTDLANNELQQVFPVKQINKSIETGNTQSRQNDREIKDLSPLTEEKEISQQLRKDIIIASVITFICLLLAASAKGSSASAGCQFVIVSLFLAVVLRQTKRTGYFKKDKANIFKVGGVAVIVIIVCIISTTMESHKTICGIYQIPKEGSPGEYWPGRLFIGSLMEKSCEDQGTIRQQNPNDARVERTGTYHYDKRTHTLYLNFNDNIGPSSVHVTGDWQLEWGEGYVQTMDF